MVQEKQKKLWQATRLKRSDTSLLDSLLAVGASDSRVVALAPALGLDGGDEACEQ